ncbi:MAG: VWA domain-containing protein [Acidobacteriota bacterium]
MQRFHRFFRRPSLKLVALSTVVASAILATAMSTPTVLASATAKISSSVPFNLPLLWADAQRAFLQDGPGLLLSAQQVEEMIDKDAVGRDAFISGFLAEDPIPETPENELLEGIQRRQELVAQEFISYLDARAQLMFLHGRPDYRTIVDCAETFRPLEIWSYADAAYAEELGLQRKLIPSEAERAGQALEDKETEEQRRRRVQQASSTYSGRYYRTPTLPTRIRDRTPEDLAAKFALENHRHLVVYRPRPKDPYRLWLPIDSKRSIYNAEMEYWLEQWEELRRQLRGGRRFDRSACDYSLVIDQVTGIDGLFGFQPNRPKNADLKAFLQPPGDIATWARKAAQTEVEEIPRLDEGELELFFPELSGLRMVTRGVVTLPASSELEPFVDGDRSELRLKIEGHVERDGKIFDEFRVRFQLPVPAEGSEVPVAMVFDRKLRTGQEFLLRAKVIEEVSGKELVLTRGFRVPSTPTPMDEPPVPEDAIVAIGNELGKTRISGYDSLVLVPPESDVIFGLWRAEALVTGERIVKVAFFLDDAVQLTRRRPPFSAELRLSEFPTEQVVKVEGYDEHGTVVASDEVMLNQPHGELKVRITDPPRGRSAVGTVKAKAEIIIPEETRITKVEFLVNDESQVMVEKPPWEAKVDVPPGQDLVYLTVVAELNDGSRAEDVRFLVAPDHIEEVDVNLVELYTTVTDKSGLLIRGLEREEFKVWEDGRPQKIAKFELVENLPLTLGVTIDTSGSMFESLGEAQRAAVGFLESMITPRDRCFALAFADKPALLMERTSDVGAVAAVLENLVANGSTSLHDAIVTSLYYYRGVRGRRALVILSDGEDTSSSLEFAEALEYAKRSGVAVFTIGLRIGKAEISVRRKLEKLAEQTGGRTFYIKEATELAAVYKDIERELRSQYLVAYSSDQQGDSGQYHEIEIKVRDGKLKARTIQGYYS